MITFTRTPHTGKIMSGENYIAANIARLRLDRQLTQEETRSKSGSLADGTRKYRARHCRPACPYPHRSWKSTTGSTPRYRSACTASRDRAIPISGTGPRSEHKFWLKSQSGSTPIPRSNLTSTRRAPSDLKLSALNQESPMRNRTGRTRSHWIWPGRAGARYLWAA